MPYAAIEDRRACGLSYHRRRSVDPVFRAKNAARQRLRRANFTDEQKAIVREKARQASSIARQDPVVRERGRLASNEWYRAAKQDPAVWARVRESSRAKYWKNHPWRLVQAVAHRAKAKGLDFDLTEAWACAQWTGLCELTGIAFVESAKVCPFSASIDRIDNAQGYVQSNCRFILYGLNSAKGTGTDADLLLIARALVEKLS
jgi:hypothetical protein